MSENYQLKTQLSATGKKIYYKGVASHIIINPDKGDDNDNWLTDKYGNLSSVLVPIIGIYATYASLPSATSYNVGSYALVTADHTLHRILLNSSNVKVWSASDAGVTVDGTRLFINTSDSNKLYRWDGSEFAAATAGGNNGSSSPAVPIIFANRIGVSTASVTPGKAKSVIYQASTDNPKIVYSRYNSQTSSWYWDTSNPVDIATLLGGGTAWQDALYIETETGKMWSVSTSDGHIAPITARTYTKLVIMTKTYYGTGWEYAMTGSADAVAPVQGGRCLILTGSTGSITPYWCYAVSNGQGGYSWNSSNLVDASDDLTPSNLFYETATDKLYMWIEGSLSLQCIAQPTTGSGSGSSNGITLVDVAGLSNTTYPNPNAW